MDCFEMILKVLLESEGYWVRHSFKVMLSKNDKKLIGRPTMPRPEIDLLAFDFRKNTVIAIEAKSFLDSTGVKFEELKTQTSKGRYKMFTDENYRKIVLSNLSKNLIDKKMIDGKTTIGLGLAAARIQKGQENDISNYFKEKKWFFWSPQEIKDKVIALSKSGYENEYATIVAKILLKK